MAYLLGKVPPLRMSSICKAAKAFRAVAVRPCAAFCKWFNGGGLRSEPLNLHVCKVNE
jgi:hypothetical protein